ncbi:transcriptional regulator [Kaistia sp. 32K]|uniref:LysR family transcriptional regulator n=1 Tax=Kaistia sp. 32K TaxID=2795690 RepID=UPI001916BE1A|nr:LysR family transcriptional regulator [Kaistia sp. 32K]BCP54001.1 transcriptional regulator [Kaistia sp. 32K]
MRFSLTQLTYFVTAANIGSVSAAARRLSISQPSISAAISHLEDLFGAALVTRHNRHGIRLTAEGKIVFEQALKLLDQAQDLEQSLGVDPRFVAGRVSLGCFDPIASYYLPALMRRLTLEFPKLDVQYYLKDQPELHQSLLNNDLNLAITYDTGMWEDVSSITLWHVSPFVLLPKGHRLSGRPGVSLGDIVDEDYILIDWPESKQYQLSLFTRTGRVPRVTRYAANLEMLRGMVAHGLGVAISVTRPVGDISYDGAPLVCIPILDSVPPQPVVLSFAKNRSMTRATQALLEFIVNYFKTEA